METGYQVFYPNQFTREEKDALDAFVAGTYVGKAHDMGLPPMENKPFTVDRYAVLAHARGWNPYNPLWTDTEYAKSAGYEDVPALPGFYSPTLRAMLPSELGEMGYPAAYPIVGDGYDHEVYYYKPIYPDDVLTVVPTGNDYVDITPVQGDIRRVILLICKGDVYNQKGEKVAACCSHYPEAFMRYEDPNQKKPETEMFLGERGAMYQRNPHVYTDQEWELIQEYWRNEKIRGTEPLYWEDVKIGDEPTPTAEAPMTYKDMIRLYGLELVGSGGCRDFVEKRGHTRMMRKNKFDVYEPMWNHYEGDTASFYNFTGRDQVVRMITNWIGDRGFVSKICWRMVNSMPPEQQVNHFPDDYIRPSYLLKVPYLKEEGAFINVHGQCPDCSFVHGYVYDKYENNEGHFVDLACWCKDIEGNYHTECGVTVKLPSRTDK